MTERDDLMLIDAALEAGVATSDDPRDRELEELALLLASEPAEPDPEFAGDLRARAAAGFPRPRRLRVSLPAGMKQRLPRLRRPSKPVLAGVASMLAAVAVAVPLLAGGDDEQPLGVGTEPAAPGGQVELGGADAPAAGAQSPDRQAAPGTIAPEPPPGGSGFEPGERRRRVERTAALTLAAPSDRIDRVADGIAEVTDRYRGFVLRSSLSTGDEGTEGGTYELRIPAGSLRAALRDLAALGEVRSRTQAGQDVTREFVSAEDRLEAARAERRSLLRRLEAADTDAEAEALRRRLDLNAGEVRGLRGQVRDLRARTDFATVSVTLQRDRESGAGGGGLDAALDDAIGSLTGAVELLVRVLGVAIPLGAVAGLGWLAATALRRRRREAALS